MQHPSCWMSGETPQNQDKKGPLMQRGLQPKSCLHVQPLLLLLPLSKTFETKSNVGTPSATGISTPELQHSTEMAQHHVDTDTDT